MVIINPPITCIYNRFLSLLAARKVRTGLEREETMYSQANYARAFKLSLGSLSNKDGDVYENVT